MTVETPELAKQMRQAVLPDFTCEFRGTPSLSGLINLSDSFCILLNCRAFARVHSAVAKRVYLKPHKICTEVIFGL